MTKKRLADLLREEQNKTAETETDALPESPASAPRKRVPTKADLEAVILELQATLTQREEQIQALEEELLQLKAQPIAVPLNLTIPSSPQLDQVQKEALQLAQANSQLIAENTALKQELEALKARGPKPIRPPLPLPPTKTDDMIWLL